MPNNDNDHPVFDHHVHVDHNDDVCTHQHDDHPRHHHDANGSIQYLDIFNVDQYDGRADAAPIGSGGYDITVRTLRTA